MAARAGEVALAPYEVVIVNFRSASNTLRVVSELQRSVGCVRITIVNNDPEERDTLRALAEPLPLVTVLEMGSNVGFATAVNRGISGVLADAVALVNPDIRVDEPCLSALYTSLRDRGAEVVGPRLVDPSGRVWRTAFSKGLTWRAVGADALCRFVTEGSVACYLLRQMIGANLSFGASRSVASLTGALWVLDVPTFQRLGGFDEDFFLYGEESDYCRRVQAAGGLIWFEARATATHIGGGSTLKRMTAQRLSSTALLFEKQGRHWSARAIRGLSRLLRRLSSTLPPTNGA